MSGQRFRVRARPLAGGPAITRIVQARHAAHARARQLVAPGDALIVEPLGPRPAWWPRRAPSGAARRDFYQQMVTCLGVEPDIVAALRTSLGLVDHDGLNLAIAAVVDALEAGEPIDAALGELAPVLPSDHLAQWRAGAAAGRLGEVLKRLAAVADREQQGLRRLRQALAYPVIVLVAALATGFHAAGQQAPVVAGMFTALGAEPPGATRALLAAHALAKAHPVLLLAAVGLLGWLVAQVPAAWRRGGAAARMVDGLPALRRVLFRLALARSLRPLALLLRAGVPVPEALAHAGGAAGHPRLGPFWNALRHDLLHEGLPPLAAALRHAALLGPDGGRLLALLRLAEQTGDFATIADRLAAVCEEEADDALGTVQALVMPVALGLVGLVIGLLVLATVVPLSRLATVVLPG